MAKGRKAVGGGANQLKGGQGHGGEGLRQRPDRAVRDDQEALGLREAEEARQAVSGRRFIVAGGSHSASRLFLCPPARLPTHAGGLYVGSSSSVRTTSSARSPSSSSGAFPRLHHATR